MKLNAVGVTAKDISQSVKFYELLGFEFEECDSDADHVEAKQDHGVKLMIDSEKLVTELIGEEPQPSNHSTFALQYDSPREIDEVVNKLKSNSFEVIKEPWNAFWGQRYAVVRDPGGNMVDLYAGLA